MLDLVGPWEVFSRLPDAHCHLIWTRPGPVVADRGLELQATSGFADAPALDILVVPGGPGQLPLMRHEPLLDFLRERAEPARMVLGVCTGSLLLAQAGLLAGRRATTHWLAREALAGLGVKVANQRYVRDGKFVTSAGVSAGIDAALAVVQDIAGDTAAATVQLALEYDPAPPLRAGSPATAPAEVVEQLRSSARPFT